MYDIVTTLPKQKYWTHDALECYARYCQCTGCRLQKLITSQKCRLNFTVIKLIEDLGVPTKNDCEKVEFNYERLKTW